MSVSGDSERHNFRLLLQMNFFIGIGISIVAATNLFDLLYLRMQFDLAWFGVIRGSMFFLPALTYFCAAPFLKGTPHSREIVQWAYAIRIGVAVLIPLLALCTANKTVLLIGVTAFTSIAYIAAAFANNTLMILYRQLLPMADFNRKNANISAVLSITSSTIALLGAGGISAAAHFSDRSFYLLFFVLTVGTGIFELMLFRISRKLLLPVGMGTEEEKFSLREHFRNAFAGLRFPVYRQLLWVTAAASFFAPLLDTYICVFLYKVHHASALVVAIASIIASYGSNFAGLWLGKWCDRIGYLKLFRRGTLAMIALTLLFGFLNGHLWIVTVFLFFVYNGSSGFLAGSLLILRGGAAAKLAPAEGGESYVAAYALSQMLCSFGGSLAAGWLFALCQRYANGTVAESFALYFKVAGVAAVILLLPLYNRRSCLLDQKRSFQKKA